jgi:hypothetical protein
MSKFDWLAIRAMYEAGDSMSSISRKEGMPSKQAISKRAMDEGWTQIDKPPPKLDVIPFDGLSDTQRVVVTEMASGLPQKYAAAIAGVSERTVTLWKAENEAFRNAVQAAIGVMVKAQLGKITQSDDWRSGLAMIERHPATRDDFAPANAQRGMTGTTFNVLGHVNLGFDRIEERVKAQEPALIEQA